MKTVVNDKNDSSKRTAAQINAILNANGISDKAENLGDSRKFCIAKTIKNLANLKKAGFITERCSEGDKFVYFRTW